jgi:hypothetical protein
MAGYTPKLKEILRAQGCYFERPGRGDPMKSGTARGRNGAFL